MATVKKVNKTIKKPVKKNVKDEVIEIKDEISLNALLKKVSDEASAKIDDLKKKFDRVDADTKKKIVTGLSVVAAGLVVLAGVSKVKSSKKKKATQK